MMRLVARFLSDTRAATSVEYAVIGAMISVAIVLGATALGTKLGSMYSALASKIPAAPT